MPSKLLSSTEAFFALLAAMIFPLAAQTNGGLGRAPQFLGETSCSSSSCHGGAGEKHNQNLIWSQKDFHSRAYATLTTARSARIADVLKISHPDLNARCTACHAPFQTLRGENWNQAADPTKGVSCESCHGPAENWLRSHTREDFSHADRVQSGMRDLKNLYVRANTCVACHQNVDADLRAAGHPELIFELDGQAVSEPKHWREATNWSGPQTWLVGQAAALREMTWQLAEDKAVAPDALERSQALLWLLQKAGPVELPPEVARFLTGRLFQPAATKEWSDQLARDTAAKPWPPDATLRYLRRLAGVSGDFRESAVSQAVQGRRAERLVLALDRLVSGLTADSLAKRLNAPLDQLFKDAQSLPDFEPATFAAHLDEFQTALAAAPEPK